MAELVATYRDPEMARRAISTLERHGIDAAHIHLLDAPGAHVPKTDAAMREPDMAVTSDVGRRGLAGAGALALIAASVAATIGWFVSDGSSSAALIGAAGGFAGGGALGFFIGGATALAVSEEWGDTYGTTGPTTLSVDVPDDQLIDLRDRLEATRPESIEIG